MQIVGAAMTTNIRFGTDGWRAIIAEDFTFENVARCAQGLADYLKSRGTSEQGLVVGYDTRFLSRNFAETVAEVCAGTKPRGQGLVPRQVCAFGQLRPGRSFGVASHGQDGAIGDQETHRSAACICSTSWS